MILTLRFIEDTFRQFNADYFNNKLPTPNFQIISTYRLLGQCGARNWRAVHPNFVIKVSNYFNRTSHEYQNTILHEMIHLYFQSKGEWNVGHGAKFQQMARSFDKFGWNIHTTEKGDNFNTVDGQIPTRTIMTFDDVKDKKVWVCCVAQDKRRMQSFKDYINGNSNYANPTFYHCNDSKVATMRENRKRLGGYTMSRERFNEEYKPILRKFDF